MKQLLPGGKLDGELQLNDTKIPLTHAYAYYTDKGDDFSESDREQLFLIFADRGLERKAITDYFTRSALARNGKLNAIEVRVRNKPQKPTEFSGYVLIPPTKPGELPMSFMLQGSNVDRTFRVLQVQGDEASGEIVMSQPETMVSLDDSAPKRIYQYRAKFQVTLLRPTPITARLTGKAALASPILAATLKGFSDLKKGDVNALRRTLSPEQRAEFDKMMASPEGRKQFAQMRNAMPTPATLRKQIKVIVVRGDRAAVLFKESGGTLTSYAARINGHWQPAGN